MTERPTDDGSEKDLQEVAIRVISSLYDSVAEGTSYEPMFFAMDDVIADLLKDADRDRSRSKWAPIFSSHFERAAHVFDIMSRQDTQTPLSFIEQQPNPAAVLTKSGQIVATNRKFDALPSAPWKDGIAPLFSRPEDASRFAALAQANSPDAQAILNLNLSAEERVVSVLAGQVPGQTDESNGTPLLYIVLIKPRWTDKTGDLLRQAFALTNAEIETLREFVACGSVKGIAETRGRSIRTVRTQLSRVFSQMGIAGQTELALFLATLSGMEPEAHRAIQGPQTKGLRSERLSTHTITVDGTQIEYFEYGAPQGKSVLLLQSSHPPELTNELRSALYHANMRVIAPLKPGSGQSDKIKGRPGPRKIAKLYAALVDDLGLAEMVVAGQASGGLYALEFAKRLPDRVKAVCLIDTGVPFKSRADLTHLPTVIRRTMVPARYFPDLLYLPHRLVAANFKRSARGEESVVDYFFTGSAHDQHLTRTNRKAYDVTRRIIAYSFDDTDRLVDDVSRWANDWSKLLIDVSQLVPVRFVHGSENTMFSADKIEAFVDGRRNFSMTRIHAGGQLAVFEHPTRLAQVLAVLAEPPKL